MGWLTGWNRRKLITVNGSNNAQYNYQLRLTVNQGSGTDSAGIVYCGGNVLSSFADLRFTKSDGSTLLNYWIESVTGTSPNLVAKVWIKLAPSPDTIPASPGTYNFYIYYNNPSAYDASSGDNTFIFFDDFSYSSLSNDPKWTTATKCTYAVLNESGGVLQQGSTRTGGYASCAGSSIYNSISIGNGAAYYFYIPLINSEGWQGYEIDFASTGGISSNTGCGLVGYPNDYYRLIVGPSSIGLYRVDNGLQTTIGTYSIGVQGLYFLIQYNVPNIYIYTSSDNQTWTSRISYSSAVSKTGITYLISTGCGDRSGTINWDNLYVRKYTSPEPTWGTISTEQNGILNITSTPTGAEIWIAPHGGSYVDQGLQTNSYTGIAPGTYDIKLTLIGYQDWYLLNQTFISGQTYNIQSTLIILPGSLAITSTPSGAEVWIGVNDWNVTTNTTITNLNPGPYNITLKLSGYQDWIGTYNVVTQQTTFVTAIFAGSANMTSLPTGAAIYLDANPSPTGNTPLIITNLTPTTSGATQSHNYLLKLTGYADTSGSFTATAGQTINVPITFPGSINITSIPIGAQIYIDGVLQ